MSMPALPPREPVTRRTLEQKLHALVDQARAEQDSRFAHNDRKFIKSLIGDICNDALEGMVDTDRLRYVAEHPDLLEGLAIMLRDNDPDSLAASEPLDHIRDLIDEDIAMDDADV